jgi:uracil-DNA glycosylase
MICGAQTKVDPDAPLALRDRAEIDRREGMLSMPHIRPLSEYATRVALSRGSDCALPYFDPCDGGVHARLLFLLEAPGPRAVKSKFVSRNNPDQSAKNMDGLLKEACLPRSQCVLWNIVPWYVGDGRRIRPVNKADINEALPHVNELLCILKQLRAVILVGKPAGSAESALRTLTSLPIYLAPHPSPKVFNTRPEKRSEALTIFRGLTAFVDRVDPFHVSS